MSLSFPIGILGQVWYLIVSIPDLYILTYFNSSDRHGMLEIDLRTPGDTKLAHIEYVKFEYRLGTTKIRIYIGSVKPKNSIKLRLFSYHSV